ncbi:hypothetical protein D3C75_499470 [compost metagenome]
MKKTSIKIVDDMDFDEAIEYFDENIVPVMTAYKLCGYVAVKREDEQTVRYEIHKVFESSIMNSMIMFDKNDKIMTCLFVHQTTIFNNDRIISKEVIDKYIDLLKKCV